MQRQPSLWLAIFLESAPDLVNRMVQEGHTVGNHTYHHPDMSLYQQ